MSKGSPRRLGQGLTGGRLSTSSDIERLFDTIEQSAYIKLYSSRNL